MARKISHKDERHDYFAAKKAKLSEQFLECRGELSEKPPQLFIGVRVYINGYTVPPAEELKNIIVKHGGIYSVFLDSAVTHMVANNLPDSKLKVLKKVKVVKPEWILDSAKQGKLLNCSEYLTYNSGKDKNIWNKIREENSTLSNSPNKVLSSLSLAEKEDKSVKPTENIPEGASSSGKNGPVAGADVHSFYSRSRLHFLSTMKMELRSHVANLKKEKNRSFSGIEALKLWLDEKRGCQCVIAPQKRIEDSIGELSHRVVIHIDMDCFFVSVSRVGRPELEGRPVVVTSSKLANFGGPFHEIKDSMADIASCSYEARAAGVRNGMRVGRALQICPKLVAVPYEFEKYRNVSYKFYEIVSSYTLDLEAVSCDELYIDCTSVLLEANCTPLEFAEHIRKEIKEKTGCSASAGIGGNHIQARLATHRAKPNGMFHLLPETVSTFMKDVKVQDLPGVGPSLSERLNELNIFYCEQLYSYGLPKLEKEFGPATGKTLYMHCQGLDSHSKEDSGSVERKSVSSEMNYGIRFTQIEEAEETLINLSKVVASKLGTLHGKSVALKLKIRSIDAPVVSAKFLGHGICDNFCRTVTLAQPTSDPEVISRAVIDLLRKSKISISDIRGIGIMMNKLEETSSYQKKSDIKEFFKHHQEKKSVQYVQRIQCEQGLIGLSDAHELQRIINIRYVIGNEVNMRKKSEPSTIELKRDNENLVSKKSAVMLRNDKPSKKLIKRKLPEPFPPNLDKSYILCSLGERDPVQLVDEEFKSRITKGQMPDKTLKNRILCILLNEVALLNISFVSSFLKELDRQVAKYVYDPEILHVWGSMIVSIKKTVLKDISKVISYPIKEFSVYSGVSF